MTDGPPTGPEIGFPSTRRRRDGNTLMHVRWRRVVVSTGDPEGCPLPRPQRCALTIHVVAGSAPSTLLRISGLDQITTTVVHDDTGA